MKHYAVNYLNKYNLPILLRETNVIDRCIPDDRKRMYVLPKRIVWHTDAENLVENPNSLLKKDRGQVTLDSHEPCILRNQGNTPGILLDFGVELQGGVQISVWDTKNNKPVKLRVRFGESANEAMSELYGDKNATNDQAVRDIICLVPRLGTHEIGNTGFRFVRIDLLDSDSFIQLKSVKAVFIYRDLEYKGSFQCSDERLNRIWKTGAYTVHLNMQDYLWDGIKRDRLVWLGDMHPEMMTINSVFGYNNIVPSSLDLICDESPLPKWMNAMSSYSLWWVLIQRDWYKYHGNLEYLMQQEEYLVNLLERLIQYIDNKGSENLPEPRFLDWPSHENKIAVHAGLHSLLLMTFEAGAELCKTLNKSAMQRKCLDSMARMKLYIPDPGGSKQAMALMVLAGLIDPVEANRKLLSIDGTKGISTFLGYYILTARAKAGDYQGCLDCIRQYWGAMLDMGATSFWEDFNTDWLQNAAPIDNLTPEHKKDIHGDFGNYCYKGFRHSLCHGWASGPTAWLTENVLGVKVLEPGCNTLSIFPNLADIEWAEGTFPTTKGVVSIKCTKSDNSTVKTTVIAPKGIRIIKDHIR